MAIPLDRNCANNAAKEFDTFDGSIEMKAAINAFISMAFSPRIIKTIVKPE